MIRVIEPSDMMRQAFPLLHEAATVAFGALEMPAKGSSRRDEERWVIESLSFMGMPVLTVFEAKRHRDDGFGWTCLWVLRSVGHVLHCQGKRGHPVDTAALDPGNVVGFNAACDWHWTSGAMGLLVVAPIEFDNPDFTDEDARREFDRKLSVSAIKPKPMAAAVHSYSPW